MRPAALKKVQAFRLRGVSHMWYHRTMAPRAQSHQRKKRPTGRYIGEAERTQIRAVLNSERFCDMTPRQIYATLLGEGRYVCHWRTMYRILVECDQVRERRNQRKHPPYRKPERLASAPNQLWSWDITKIRGPCDH